MPFHRILLSLTLVLITAVTARAETPPASPEAPVGSAAPSPAAVPTTSPTPDAAPTEAAGGAAKALQEKLAALKHGSVTIDEFVQYTIDTLIADSTQLATFEKSIAELPGVERVALPLLQKRLLKDLPTLEASKLEQWRTVSKALLVADPDVMKTFHDLLSKIGVVLAAAADAKWSDATQGIQAVKATPERNALGENVLKSYEAAVARAADGAQLCDAYTGCMVLAGSLPGDRLAPIAESILQRLQAQVSSLPESCSLESKPGIALLRSVVQLRQSAKATAIQLLDARLRSTMKHADPERLLEMYTSLLEFRPDPDPENQNLRLWIVLHADGPAAHEFALGRFQEMKYAGGLTVTTRFRVLMKGYYGQALPYLIIGAAVVALLCVVIVLFRPLFVASVVEVVARAESGKPSAGGGQGPGGGKRYAGPRAGVKTSIFKRGGDRPVPGYMRGPVEDDEYTKLLKMLDLDDEATESEIKKAYRDRVKKLHPDTKPGEVSEDQSEFIELKEIYDRILQIRSSWFGVKK